MNINRKIQCAAVAVIANGALAAGLLSTSPVLAATCGPRSICLLTLQCANITLSLYAQLCNQIAPPGCTWTGGHTCANNQCGTQSATVTCY